METDHTHALEYKILSTDNREQLTKLVQGHIDQQVGWRPEGPCVPFTLSSRSGGRLPVEFIQTMVRYGVL